MKKEEREMCWRGWATICILCLAAAGGPSAAWGDLVAYWNMDMDRNGNVTDLSGHGNNGATSQVARLLGICGMATEFEGHRLSYMHVPFSPSLDMRDALTVELWIYPYEFRGGRVFIGRSENSWVFQWADNILSPMVRTFISGVPLELRGITAMPLREWNHIAFTYDGHLLKLYVNGVLDNTQTRSGSIGSDSADLFIGSLTVSPDEALPFYGLIDDVIIYNHALTGSEIAADMICGPHSAGSSRVPAQNESSIDFRSTRAIFGYNGRDRSIQMTLEEFQFRGASLTAHWTLDYATGNWNWGGLGDGASGEGGVLDFSAATVSLGGNGLIISNLRFQNQTYTLHWRFNPLYGSWVLEGIS